MHFSEAPARQFTGEDFRVCPRLAACGAHVIGESRVELNPFRAAWFGGEFNRTRRNPTVLEGFDERGKAAPHRTGCELGPGTKPQGN